MMFSSFAGLNQCYTHEAAHTESGDRQTVTEALDTVATGISWAAEPWTCSPAVAQSILYGLMGAADAEGDLYDGMENEPRESRKLLWHLPADQSMATLFAGEDHKPGLIYRLADGERDFDEQGPGTDHDAWKRYFERIRYVVAFAARGQVLSLQRLAMIALVLDTLQTANRDPNKDVTSHADIDTPF